MVVLDLDDINDVNSSAADTGEVVTYNTSTQKWSPSGGGNVSLGSPPPGGWIPGTVGDAIASGGGPAPVTSVNSKTGAVVLTAGDVGALPADTQIPVLPQFIVNTVNGKSGNVVLTSVDVGALPEDTTIPPDYGPPPVTSVNGQTGEVVLVIPPPAPVDSVNGKIGVVVLNAADVGALPEDTEIPQPIDPPVKSVNGKIGDVELSVEDLEDVALTTETAGEVLRFDGTNWVNSEEAVQELHSSDGSVSVTNEAVSYTHLTLPTKA